MGSRVLGVSVLFCTTEPHFRVGIFIALLNLIYAGRSGIGVVSKTNLAAFDSLVRCQWLVSLVRVQDSYPCRLDSISRRATKFRWKAQGAAEFYKLCSR